MENLSSPIDHANHNFKLSQLLNSQHPDFGDWVITTAYYSAIHFVCHKLFPGLYVIGPDDKNFSHFNEYYEAHKKYNRNFPHLNPHAVREKLVFERLPLIMKHYKDLKDFCWTARYKNYKPQRQAVEIAIEAIAAIKAYCDEDCD